MEIIILYGAVTFVMGLGYAVAAYDEFRWEEDKTDWILILKLFILVIFSTIIIPFEIGENLWRKWN